MKRFLAHPTVAVLTLGLLLFACSFVHASPTVAQIVRYSAPFPSVSSAYATPFLVANVPPNAPILAICNSPANQVPCTNYATTYTSSAVACPNGAQDTPDPQPSGCQGTGDAQGNIGFWAVPGKYDYTVCIQNTVTCFGPYTITLGNSAVTPAIVISPATASISTSATQTFTFSLTGTPTQNVTWACTAGTINQSTGVYTAPGSANVYYVFVVSGDVGIVAVAVVTVTGGMGPS